MRPDRTVLAATTAVLAALVLSACSGGSSASTGTNTGNPAATTSSSPTRSTGSATSSAPNPNATESNPPGDIPDSQVFVTYQLPGAHFTVKVPEGWSRTQQGSAVVFTDKYNSVRIESVAASKAPTVASARSTEVPQIASTARAFRAGPITTVRRQAGSAILIKYLQDSEPNPVTDRVVRGAVERYEFWRGGQEAVLTLSGPKGADNVDPWKTVSDSLRWH